MTTNLFNLIETIFNQYKHDFQTNFIKKWSHHGHNNYVALVIDGLWKLNRLFGNISVKSHELNPFSSN